MAPAKLTEAQNRANRLLAGPQRHTCLVGGSRSGKTTLFMRGLVIRALRGDGSRHAALRFRHNAAWKSLALDTLPAVMRRFFPGVPWFPHRADGFFSFPNRSEIWIGGLDDKERVERILGQEFCTLLFNECSQIPYASVVLAMTRLAQVIPGLRQRAWYDLNPVGRTHWTNMLFGEHREPTSRQSVEKPEDYARMFMNPEDNAANLTSEYLASLRALPKRQRNRFYHGVYVDEYDNALWTYEAIEKCRRPAPEDANIRRVVVAVDASGASGREDLAADEIGIVVMALGIDGHGYVLADRSCRESPAVWGRRVADTYDEFGADCVVAEKNFGGEMVRFVIQSAVANRRVEGQNNVAFRGISVRMVTASRGKAVRAEPVSALYGDDVAPPRIHHCDAFVQLEDQLCGFTTTGYMGDESPDRADALVWAATELMLGHQAVNVMPIIVTAARVSGYEAG